MSRVAGPFRNLAVITVLALLGGAVAAPPAPAATVTATAGTDLATQMANAIAQDPSVVTGASFVTRPPNGTPDKVESASLTGFPTDGSSYGTMTTGDASQAPNAPQSNFASAADGGGNVRGNTDYDVSILKVDLNVPDTANCLRVDFRFLSEEFPEYVGSSYNDAFIAELDSLTWTTSGSNITATNNFAKDPDGNPVSINSTGFAHMTAQDASGTIYDGASPVLVAETPVTTGAHSIYLSIFDQGDSVYDSAVFLDNLILGNDSAGQCTVGAKPNLSLGLSVSPNTTPPGIDAASLGSIPFSAIPQGTTPTATAPIGKSPIGKSPIGKSPIGKSPIGKSPIGKSPIGKSPIGKSPIGKSPIGKSPIGKSPIGKSPLSAFPTTYPGGWSAILAGSCHYATATPQTVTLQQLVEDTNTSCSAGTVVSALDPNNTTDPLTLDQINFALSPMANTSLLAFLLGNLTWNDVANSTPAGPGAGTVPGWCAEWAQIGQPACASSSDSRLAQAIVETEANGLPIDLTSLPRKHLSDVTGPQSSFFWSLTLIDLNIPGSFLRDIQIGAIPSANRDRIVNCGKPGIDCADGSTQTLGQAFGVDPNGLTGLHPDGTFADLGTGIGNPTLSDIELAFLDPSAIAWEEAPLADVPFETLPSGAPTHLVTYSLGYDIPCANTAGMTASVLLPTGFRYRPGSSYETIGSGSPTLISDPTKDLSGRLRWSLAGCSSSPSQHFSLTFKAMPGFDTGDFGADASVTTSSASATLSGAASVAVSDTVQMDGGDTPATATAASAGTMYVGHVSSPSDRDYYTFDAQPGQRVTVTLSHLSRDYDMVLYEPAGSAAASALRAPADVQAIPFGKNPLPDPASLGATDILPPETLQDIPLATGLPVAGVSAFRGTDPDAVTTTAIAGTGPYTVQVSGFNGASGPEPYVLLIRVSDPTELPICPARSFAHPSDVPAATVAPATIAPTTNTLVLLDQGRLARTFGATDEGLIMTKLQALNAVTGVNAQVVPLDSSTAVGSAFGAADANPCSPAGNNNVVRTINDYVDSLKTAANGNLANVKNIVIVGDDYLIPHARILDTTTDGNETEFTGDALFGTNNELAGSFGNGYFMSDSPYGTLTPLSLAGQVVYLPQAAVGRLGGSAQTIENAIDQFVTKNGKADPRTLTTDPTTALVTDYDFFTDGGAQVVTNLGTSKSGPSNLTIDTLSGGSWNKTDFASKLYPSTGSPPDVISPNAHYDQYRLLPGAAGSGNPPSFTSADLYTTGDLTAAGTPSLPLRLIFGIGCHMALDFPDQLQPGDPRVYDWEQAYFDKGAAVLVGNLGFGLGDTATVAFSEQLMANFAKDLGATSSVGGAFVKAQRDYFTSMGSFSPYQLKAMQEAVMWGFPMYRVPWDPPTPSSAAASTVGTDPVSGLRSSTIDLTTNLHLTTLTDGRTFYDADGLTDATHPYPIMPKVVTDIPSDGANFAHGAIPLSLTTSLVGVSNYAFANATIDSSANEPAPAVAVRYPSTPQGIGTSVGADGLPSQSLVVLPGQFRSGPNDPADGTFLQFTQSHWLVTYSSDATDFTGPDIGRVDAVRLVASGRTDFSVYATETAGDSVVRVLGQAFMNDGTTVTPVEFARDPADATHWTASLASTSVSELWVFALDGHGNSSSSTNKAIGYIPVPPPPSGSVITTIRDSSGNDLSSGPGGWYGTRPVLVNVASSNGETFTGQLDGGASQSFPITVGTEGQHTVSYAGSKGSTGTIPVKIDVTDPSITSAWGGAHFAKAGTDYVAASGTLNLTMGDAPSGVYLCSINVDGTPSSCGAGVNSVPIPSAQGTYSVQASVEDNAGNVSSLAVTAVRDTTGPSVAATHTANGSNGWNTTSPVTEGVTASDAGAGLASVTCSPSNPSGSIAAGQASFSGSLSVSGEGTHPVSCTATDAVGNVSSAAMDSVKIDTVKPGISITRPGAGASYNLNQVVTAAYSCSDGTSGVVSTTGPPSCTGDTPNGTSINTASIGSKSFTVSSVDQAGNTNAQTITYYVGYRICLLYDPAKPYKQGSGTVPLKLQICDQNGVNKSSSSITLTAVELDGPGTKKTIPPPVNNGSGNRNFTYDSKLAGYIYTISTKGLAVGSYDLKFRSANENTSTTLHDAPFNVQ